MNNLRNKKAYWEYNGDGRWDERIKGQAKKHHKKLSKKYQKRILKEQLEDEGIDLKKITNINI